MKPVAIIGAGITGLTAAFRLREQGIPITLYEAGSQAGGVIRTLRKNGYLAECGPNTILETSPEIGVLIRDLGLVERRLYSDPNAESRYIARRGKPVALPGSPPAFVTNRLFSVGAKLRLLREPFIRRSPAAAEENLAAFVLRRLGREFLDYAINPFVGGVYAGDPAKLSVKHAFPKLHALEQNYGSLIRGQILGARERKRRGTASKQSAAKLSFDEGLQVLTDALFGKLSDAVRLDTPVDRIRQDGAGWEVSWQGRLRRETATHSALLLALPAYRIAQLDLKTESGGDHTVLGEIEYPPVTSLVLGFPREAVAHSLRGFGVLVPEVEGFHILGTIFSSSLFPNRAPEDHVTLTCYLGGARSPGLALLEPDRQIDLALRDLRTLLGVTGSPTFTNLHCFRNAIPQYNVGYGKYIDVMNDLERKSRGLFLAGHYRDGISLSDSIVAGGSAAGRIAEFVKSKKLGAPQPAAVAGASERQTTHGL